MNLKRSRFLASLALALAVILAAPPAWADRTITLEASSLKNANGNSLSYDAAGFATAQVLVNVTTGAATVNPFKVSLEGSMDGGTTWLAIPCGLIAKDVGGPGGTVTITAAPGHTLIVNEVAAITAATQYVATCTVGAPLIRAHWQIAGGGSETFSVAVNLK